MLWQAVGIYDLHLHLHFFTSYIIVTFEFER